MTMNDFTQGTPLEVVARVMQIMFGLSIPFMVIALVIRRKIQKRRFYAQADDHSPIEGTLDELNEVNPRASPWTNDERRRLLDTKEIIGRFNTIDGYSAQYVEDLMTVFRKSGIACESLFQETLPMGVASAIVSPIGTFEVFVERERLEEALRLFEEFKSR